MTEKKMFGGLAFLIGGNMAVAASGQGGVFPRLCTPRPPTRLVATTKAQVACPCAGRPMAGWLRVGSDQSRERTSAGQVGRARHDVRPLAAAKR